MLSYLHQHWMLFSSWTQSSLRVENVTRPLHTLYFSLCFVSTHVHTHPNWCREHPPGNRAVPILRRWFKQFADAFIYCKSDIWMSCLEELFCYISKIEEQGKKEPEDVWKRWGSAGSPSLAWGSSLLPLQPTGLINGSKDKRDSFVPIWAINSPKFSRGLKLCQLIKNSYEHSTFANLRLQGWSRQAGKMLPSVLPVTAWTQLSQEEQRWGGSRKKLIN